MDEKIRCRRCGPNMTFPTRYIKIFTLLPLLLAAAPDKHRGLGVPRHKGCPANALCSKKAGQLRHQWKQLLIQSRKYSNRTKSLETFRLQKGIPLSVWSLPGKDTARGVHFDSPCEKWMKSEVFASDFTKLNEFVVRRGYLLKNKTIRPYLVPRGDVPLYEKNDRLYYNRHFQGEYYGISIGPKGDIRTRKTVMPSMPYDFPQKTTCPQNLLNHFSKNNHDARPDRHPRCFKLPGTGKRPLILLLGMSCS